MEDREKMIKMRDVFLETAYVLDELIELDEREGKGEDIEKEAESVVGKLMFKMVELQSLMD